MCDICRLIYIPENGTLRRIGKMFVLDKKKDTRVCFNCVRRMHRCRLCHTFWSNDTYMDYPDVTLCDRNNKKGCRYNS